MTPQPNGIRAEAEGGSKPERLDYVPVIPIARRSMTFAQRLVLAAFILFPLIVIFLFMLAALSEGP